MQKHSTCSHHEFLKSPWCLLPLLSFTMGCTDSSTWVPNASHSGSSLHTAESTTVTPITSRQAHNKATHHAASNRTPNDPAVGLALDDAVETKSPKCVAKQRSHYFGVMAPNEHIEHTFTIENKGLANLQVVEISSSCKCVSTVLPGPILPGQSGEVKLRWFARQPSPAFAQTLEVKTNDPVNKFLTFKVYGKVAPLVAFEPTNLVLPSVRQDKTTESSIKLYSGQWKNFRVDSFKPSLPSISCLATQIGRTQLSESAKSGYRLDVSLPADLPKGHFEHQIVMTVTPTDPPGDPRDITLNVGGEVVGRLRVSGQGIGSDGVVRIEADPRRGKQRERLLLKVRDGQPQLTITELEISHPSITARLEKPRAQLANRGLHYLCLEVDAASLKQSLIGAHTATLHCEFDHPRLDPLNLNVEVILTPARGG